MQRFVKRFLKKLAHHVNYCVLAWKASIVFMKRIAIIGPPGAGKSTLARDLYGIHNIKIYHLDRILWERGWKWKLRDTKIDIDRKSVV